MADIKVRITAVDEASKPLDEAGKKAKTTADAMKTLSGSIASVAAGMGLQLGVSAFVSTLKNAIVGSFELADALEQSTIAFTTMLGSGEAAGKMLTDLKAFADKTPFEFQDIQAAAKRLMAMGTAAEDVIPTLRAVGDAAAGLGGGKATIDGITLALGQMGAKGKISTQELNQLTERGIPALKYLAEAAGVSTGAMAKMVENGIVPADKGIKVLLEHMQKDFGGLMAKQADTASGKLSTMKDAVAGLGTEIGKSLVPAVKSGADVISVMAQKAAEYIAATDQEADQVAALADAFKKGLINQTQFNSVVDTTALSVDQLTGSFIVNAQSISNTIDATELLKIAAKAEAEELKIASERSSTWSTQLGENTTALELNKAAVDPLTEAVKQHKAALELVKGVASDYRKEHENNAEAAKKAQKKIDDLTKAHDKNHAALLAGKGTVVDNTDAIERASIAAERNALSLDALNERYANQDNINNYNDSVRDIGTAQNELNDQLAKGEIDQTKFDKATEKNSERLTDYKKSLDDSQMSQQEYSLNLRDATLDTKDNTARLAELNTEHGKGYTAVQLAAGEQATYNTKLKEAQTELDKTKLKEVELRNYVATAIKENIIDRQIEQLAKDGLTEEEILNIQNTAAAFGIATSDKIKYRLLDEASATALDTIEELVKKNYIDGTEEQKVAHKAMIESISQDITNGFVPDMAKAEKAAKLALGELLLFKGAYDSLQSKEIILTVRQQKIFEEQASTAREQGQVYGDQAQPEASPAAARAAAAANAAAGNFQVGGQKGAHATGGAIIGNGNWRATGGAMGMGGGYLVGEHGPELFDPAGSGRVFSNNTFKQLGSSQQSGGNLRIGTLNIYGVQTASQLYDAITAEARARGLTFGLN